MPGYRLTKYDPALRDEHGHYVADDWTAFSDVGKFNGLTMERYLEVEAAHLAAIEAFAVESGVERLGVWRAEGSRADAALLPAGLLDVLHDGYEVSLADALLIVRAMLRETFWCELATDGFTLHIGWDYYIYITSHVPCENAVRGARELGLFPEPFSSPYFRDPDDAYPPVDEAFWRRIEEFAEHAGPVPVLEMRYGGCWRWHLVRAGNRPALAPRSVVSVYARLTGRRLPTPARLHRSTVEPDFEGVLPDADGVVRARWTR